MICVAFEYKQSSEAQSSEQSQGGSFNESIDERHNQSQAEQDWRWIASKSFWKFSGAS